MNHKRGKPKNARAGCLLCKPNKANGANKARFGHSGFGKLRTLVVAREEVRAWSTARCLPGTIQRNDNAA
jgi:hypothetical protein